jgi:hypothetical protein
MLTFHKWLVQRHMDLTPPPQSHAGTVEHDSSEPGRDLRLSSELVQVLAGGEKSVLNRIFGVGSVAQKSVGTSVKRGQAAC